ncbi:MAG: glycosyltransferase family 4 protein [Alphaproteobacteria bacterium]|nr:glycosyltransferase family 4 protein [Alphaproteobacteria bacterium]
MRVLLVSIGDQILREPNGSVAERLHGYAARAGCISQLVYSPAANRRRATRVGRHMCSYPTRSRDKLGFFPDALALGRRLLSDERYDLIETQDPVAAGLIGVALGRSFGLPVVLGCHNDFYASQAWLRENWRTPLEYALARWTLARADGARVVSRALACSVIRHGLPRNRVAVAPVPVDRGLFARGKADTPTRRGWTTASALRVSEGQGERVPVRHGRRVLFVGRVVRQKDVPTLIRAMALVPNASLDVAGDGPELPLCRALAAELGVSATFHGNVAPDALSALYWRAAVGASPALYEGYGRVLVELALHGTPVVATPVGGVPDVVLDGETGLLVPPADPVLLAGSITRLLDDPAQARQLGQRAWERAVDRFDPDRQSDEIVAFWRNIGALGPRRR